MKKFTFLWAVLCILAFGACKEDSLTPEEQLEADKIALRAYIADKGLVVDSLPSGLYYVITKEGVDNVPLHPNINSTVKVGYKGYFLNGDEFDGTAPGETIEFPLRNLITGWQQGIPLMKKEGKATLLLPSALGYGPNGSGSIPPNTPIIFDIELFDF
jgi:FKBP-type peptidyl-prolyl cis-trans isomerase FkpA